MENTKGINSYKQLERAWLDAGDADDRPDWRVARAILLLAAEVRDLTNVVDETGKDIVHELEAIRGVLEEANK